MTTNEEQTAFRKAWKGKVEGRFCPKCGNELYYDGDNKNIICSHIGSMGCDYLEEIKE